mmetsp:Transcript_31837/g.83203  ORF Transcript_31837/g.83203 Transcript_31837/m.83203 type:complete len:274 (+) Transcript_31837:173-994(+)
MYHQHGYRAAAACSSEPLAFATLATALATALAFSATLAFATLAARTTAALATLAAAKPPGVARLLQQGRQLVEAPQPVILVALEGGQQQLKRGLVDVEDSAAPIRGQLHVPHVVRPLALTLRQHLAKRAKDEPGRLHGRAHRRDQRGPAVLVRLQRAVRRRLARARCESERRRKRLLRIAALCREQIGGGGAEVSRHLFADRCGVGRSGLGCRAQQHLRVGCAEPLEGVAGGALDVHQRLAVARPCERHADTLATCPAGAPRAMHIRLRLLPA